MRASEPPGGPGSGPAQPGPVVSVIIPNYNHEAFVVQAVDSALAQTYQNLEVIVVDDASSDDSVARLKDRYGDRIQVLALPTNGGQVCAVEAGFRISSGEVVCLLDADDRWLPQKVERVVAAFAADPELTQLSHGLRSIDAEGRPLTGRWPLLRGRLERRMPLSEGDVRSLLFRWNRYGYGITSGLSYPRWVLERSLPVPEEFEGVYFDTWSTVAAAFLGPVGAIRENLMEYRTHGANASAGSTTFSRNLRCWRATGAIIDHWARCTGDPRRSDVEQADNRLVLFRYLDGEPVPLASRMRAVARTPIELWTIDAQPLDGSIRMAERVVSALSRRSGVVIKQVGLNRWLRQRGAAEPRQRRRHDARTA